MVPKSIVGNWTGKQKVIVRFKNSGLLSYNFKTSPDSVMLSLTIKEDGNVSGSFGSAFFESCTVDKNRGWVGRKLNIATDYIIRGNLKGTIFASDILVQKEISFPFSVAGNALKGTIFQKQGMDIYPMVNVHLIK